jgi:hypothetical protein
MFNQTEADQAPFRGAGLVGLNQYTKLLGLGGVSGNQQYTAAGTGGGPQGYESSAADAAYLKANPDVAKDPYFSTHPYQHYLTDG